MQGKWSEKEEKSDDEIGTQRNREDGKLCEKSSLKSYPVIYLLISFNLQLVINLHFIIMLFNHQADQ